MGTLKRESLENDQWLLAVELLMGDLRMAAESTQENSFDGELIIILLYQPTLFMIKFIHPQFNKINAFINKLIYD